VVTASFQTALEASVAGAEVMFIEISKISNEEIKLLKEINIRLISLHNKHEYKQIIIDNVTPIATTVCRSDTIVTKVINRL
jgi:hypothetical protein